MILSGCGHKNQVVGTWEFVELRPNDTNSDQEFINSLESSYLRNKYTIEFTRGGEYKSSIENSGGSYYKNGDPLSIAVAVLREGTYRMEGQSIQVYSPHGEVELEYFIEGNTLWCNFDEGIVGVFERK